MRSGWPGCWQGLKTSTGARADAFVCVCVRKKLCRGVWQHAFPILRGDCSWHSVAQAAHTLCGMYTHSFIITQSNMVIKASA